VRDQGVQSVANKLIKRISVYCGACVLAIGVVEGWYAWRHLSEDFDQGLRLIAESQLPLLAVSVWEAEPLVIQRQLVQISQQPYIGYVRLRADIGAVFEAGDTRLHNHPNARIFNLAQPYDRDISLGTLELAPDPTVLYYEVGRSVGVAMLGYGVLCLLIIVLLKREVERPLRHILDFVAASPDRRNSQALVVERGQDHRRDEIDIVVEGFQSLHKEIDKQMRDLDAQVADRTNALQSAMESIQQLSTMDPLTGCYNRRLFNERIAQEAERADRHQRALTLVFADIDFFKRVNDAHGHLVGDQALCHVSTIMRRETRESVDWVVRYGGEEFLLVLPETDQEQAIGTAERLRAAIEAEPLFVRGQPIALTCSFGVAQYQPDEPYPDWLERVDKCLYTAKQNGRNRICAWENHDIQI
jgi:diguanylate cyclase (GGDEF)-like protein